MILGWGLAGWSAHRIFLALFQQFGQIGATSIDSLVTVSAVIMCLIGSLFMMLAIRTISKKIKIYFVLLLISGWVVSRVIMSIAGQIRIPGMGYYFSNISFWKFIGFLMGGLTTGFIYMKASPALRWTHVTLIALNWVMAPILGGLALAFEGYEIRGVILFGKISTCFSLVGGLLIGAICGGLSLLIMHWAQKQNNKVVEGM